MKRCSSKTCSNPVEKPGYCAECRRAYRKAWKAAHPGYFTEKRRQWALENPERARETDRRKYERWKSAQPPKPPRPAPLSPGQRKTRHLAANPIKAACYGIYRYALRRGDLVRGPCAVCGEPKTEGHHTDYTKPLDVVWLCPEHHREEHRRLTEKQTQVND